MKKLNLYFMNDKIVPVGEPNSMESILDEYGTEIATYSQGYFDKMITTTKTDDITNSATLYIIVPEIGYNYRMLNLRLERRNYYHVTFFTLKSHAEEVVNIDTTINFAPLHDKIIDLLNSRLANETFKFLVNQVDMKRENKV